MGANSVSFLPFDCDSGDVSYSHTILPCVGAWRLHAVVRPLEEKYGRQVPEHFTSYFGPTDEDGIPHYGYTAVYATSGDPVLCLEAKYLKPLASAKPVTIEPKNVACWAYLCALPDDTRVAIYWC